MFVIVQVTESPAANVTTPEVTTLPGHDHTDAAYPAGPPTSERVYDPAANEPLTPETPDNVEDPTAFNVHADATATPPPVLTTALTNVRCDAAGDAQELSSHGFPAGTLSPPKWPAGVRPKAG